MRIALRHRARGVSRGSPSTPYYPPSTPYYPPSTPYYPPYIPTIPTIPSNPPLRFLLHHPSAAPC
ncbi:MAG: hypothetical protein IKO85_10540 [Bacteroidaceae bacterium]|nr:hypothetical protein [Bacteroidaceae bacterium]